VELLTKVAWELELVLGLRQGGTAVRMIFSPGGSKAEKTPNIQRIINNDILKIVNIASFL
jgi:hypothetical protein